VHQEILTWAAAERRDLPWRQTRDPWAVLVSELMLQQTQVARVVARYDAFLAVYPTPASCARASLADVVRAWAGLGYNRRAAHLHRCAQAVVERHDGTVPDQLDQLLPLPGVGAYTARAVLAFAYERDVAVLDTNVARVLARAVAGCNIRGRAEAQRLADSLVPAGQGWAWNQALIDLGATCCLARAPRCDRCPVVRTCAWAAAGWPAPDPASGSAGTSAVQGRFAGSDRQGRGRLVDALRHGPVRLAGTDLAAACGWPDDAERAARVVDALVDDGLAVASEGWLSLPP
jgi:A/G-specific adenine glycosylase